MVLLNKPFSVLLSWTCVQFLWLYTDFFFLSFYIEYLCFLYLLILSQLPVYECINNQTMPWTRKLSVYITSFLVYHETMGIQLQCPSSPKTSCVALHAIINQEQSMTWPRFTKILKSSKIFEEFVQDKKKTNPNKQFSPSHLTQLLWSLNITAH